jgi:hypothetical protein
MIKSTRQKLLMKVGCSVVKIKTKTALHILLLPSSYPTSSAPVRGVFVQQQAVALRRIGVKVGVIYPYFRSLRDFNIAALSDNHFQINFDEEEGIPTYRFCGWNIPRLRLEPFLWKRRVKRLYESYVDKNGIPDLLHAHNILWGGFSAMEIGEQTGLPFVVTEHTSFSAALYTSKAVLNMRSRRFFGFATDLIFIPSTTSSLSWVTTNTTLYPASARVLHSLTKMRISKQG